MRRILVFHGQKDDPQKSVNPPADLIKLYIFEPSSLNSAEEIFNEKFAQFSRYLFILTSDISIHSLNERSEIWPGLFNVVRLLQARADRYDIVLTP
jgi:hypothetical protein